MMGCGSGIGTDGGAMMMGSPDFLSSGAGAGATGGSSSTTNSGGGNGNYNYSPVASATGFSDLSFEARLRLTETLLAIVWVSTSNFTSTTLNRSGYIKRFES